MTTALTPTDFRDYLSYYADRTKRRTGHSPATSTLRTKASQLSATARRLGVTDPTDLGRALADRDGAERVLDALLTTMTTGGARSALFTLVDHASYLHAHGLCEPPVVTKDDVPPPNPQGPIRTYTADEVELLISAARGVSLRWFGFVATLAETGRRPGEVLGLEWSYARFDDNPPHFVLPTTKTRRPQYLPLTERLMREVYTPENVALLKCGKGGPGRKFQRSPERHPFPMSYSSVNSQWVKFTERLGLAQRGGLHKLRHTKATTMLAAGVPIHAVSRLLGHANVTTTMRAYDATTALTFTHYLDGNGRGEGNDKGVHAP